MNLYNAFLIRSNAVHVGKNLCTQLLVVHVNSSERVVQQIAKHRRGLLDFAKDTFWRKRIRKIFHQLFPT